MSHSTSAGVLCMCDVCQPSFLTCCVMPHALMLCCAVLCPAELTGTIPPSIKKLPNLKHVFLSFNKLNGSLDGHFCTKQNDPLEVLILRANFLSGTADLSACTELLLLDLTVGCRVQNRCWFVLYLQPLGIVGSFGCLQAALQPSSLIPLVWFTSAT